MAVPASQPSLEGTYRQISGSLSGAKNRALTTYNSLTSGSVNTYFLWAMIDAFIAILANINAQSTALGSGNFGPLNDYVNAQVPGYSFVSGAISSGTYTSGTGAVSLTTATAHGLVPGSMFKVSGATGTGAFASVNGWFTAGAGTAGSTLNYAVATGLTMTITGGSAVVGNIYTNDVVTAMNNTSACIAWVTANFPTSGGFALAEVLNGDGTRTPANFTTAQTAGLQTVLTTLYNSIN